MEWEVAESRCFDQILGLDATLPAFLLAQIATKQMEKNSDVKLSIFVSSFKYQQKIGK